MDPKELLKDEQKFKAFAKQSFAQFDKNKNGMIEMAEFATALRVFAKESNTTLPDDGIINETMKELDKNSSNTLTIDEFESFVRTILIQMTS